VSFIIGAKSRYASIAPNGSDMPDTNVYNKAFLRLLVALKIGIDILIPSGILWSAMAIVSAIPNFIVYSPADFKETLGAYNAILSLKKPSALVLSKQKVKQIGGTSVKKVINGGYVVRKEKENLNAILIATGSEVETCINIASELYDEGYDVRVVSMPSIELFMQKPKTYRYNVLPAGVKTFFVEAGCSSGLRKFVSNDKYLITVDSFGKSGKSDDVLNKMNFNYEKIKKRIKDLL